MSQPCVPTLDIRAEAEPSRPIAASLFNPYAPGTPPPPADTPATSSAAEAPNPPLGGATLQQQEIDFVVTCLESFALVEATAATDVMREIGEDGFKLCLARLRAVVAKGCAS